MAHYETDDNTKLIVDWAYYPCLVTSTEVYEETRTQQPSMENEDVYGKNRSM